MLPILLACGSAPPAPTDWASPADCAALPPSGRRDVCYSEVLPAVFCADPARGAALLSEIQATDFRDGVLLRVTQAHFPDTFAFCARITDTERQTLCRDVVVSARLKGLGADPACAAAPRLDPPRAPGCDCEGPDTALRILAPRLEPEADLDPAALLGTLPAQLARCHQKWLYPGCPCLTGEATVVLWVSAGRVMEATVEGALPPEARDCLSAAATGHAFGDLTGTVRLPLRLAPQKP
jgi:hypothetical protein